MLAVGDRVLVVSATSPDKGNEGTVIRVTDHPSGDNIITVDHGKWKIVYCEHELRKLTPAGRAALEEAKMDA